MSENPGAGSRRRRRALLLLVLVVLVMIARLGDMAVREAYRAPGPLRQKCSVVIPPQGTAAAARALARAGAVSHPLLFRAFAAATRGEGPLRAGEFALPAHASLAEILSILRHAAPVQHRLTIPEGLTATQIVAIVAAAPSAAGPVSSLPEGSILPQTYDYILGTARAQLVARAASALAAALPALWAKRDPTVPLATPAQAVILASIVQVETPIAAELPEVAAVYENRLRRGMRLQADPTVIYAASGGGTATGRTISRADLADPSPYNTYAHGGLPPGPISAPGIAAITAVLHPSASDALYFVATGQGGHLFSDSFDQQLKNVAAYRRLYDAAELDYMTAKPKPQVSGWP